MAGDGTHPYQPQWPPPPHPPVVPLTPAEISSGATPDEIRTVLISGLPEDVKERELQNFLRWLPGYEASRVKVKGEQQKPLGYALFTTAQLALAAKDALQEMAFDADSESVLQADMAKKNLIVKRGGATDSSAANQSKHLRNGSGYMHSSYPSPSPFHPHSTPPHVWGTPGYIAPPAYEPYGAYPISQVPMHTSAPVQKKSESNAGGSSSKGKGKSGAKTKATWDAKTHDFFINLCLEEVRAGNRPSTHFTRLGWNNLLEKFSKTTGKHYDRLQLKNHWDVMKKEWQLWESLVGNDTSLGWDSKKQTVDASDEWWEEKIQINPDFEKFREKGLEHCFKLDELFMDFAVTGPRAWAPSSSELPSQNTLGSAVGGDESEDIDGDSENENEATPILENINSDPNGRSPPATSLGKRSSDRTDIYERKGKRLSIATELSRRLDRILNAMENRSTATSARIDPSGCSIIEVVNMMSAIPEIPPGSELFMLGTRLFLKSENREMFVALADPTIQLAWLKQEQTRENLPTRCS